MIINVYSQYEGYELDMLLQCYNMRARLIGSRVFIKEFYDYAEKVKTAKEAIRQREQEISRREKALERALEDNLKNGKLTQHV